jgi:rhomboid family GlyGly-CTERM serine protease
MFQRLFRFRREDLILPVLLALVLAALWLAGDDLLLRLRYERTALPSGEAWRLVTGHLVHADGVHLAWNILGVGIVWTLFASDYRPLEWLAIILASMVAIDAGFAVLQPELEWYVGFSGVLHGCIAAGLLAWLSVGRDWVTAVVATLFAAKLIWEHRIGPLPFTSQSLTLPVIHEAHTYGALGGAFCGACVLIWRTRRGSPL